MNMKLLTIGQTVLKTCNSQTPPTNDAKNYQSVDKVDTLVFSYDVHWEKSDTEWGSRYFCLYTYVWRDRYMCIFTCFYMCICA
jgi:hypothetical protein